MVPNSCNALIGTHLCLCGASARTSQTNRRIALQAQASGLSGLVSFLWTWLVLGASKKASGLDRLVRICLEQKFLFIPGRPEG